MHSCTSTACHAWRYKTCAAHKCKCADAWVHAQVEAGLSDLRQAYAELHEQLDGKQEQKPPEEQQRIRQHVSLHSALTLSVLICMGPRCESAMTI